MEKLSLILIPFLAVLAAAGCDPHGIKGSQGVYASDAGTVLLGPEAFKFCGGWVELWGQVEPWQGTRLFVKVSPPPSVAWHFWNSHVVVESSEEAGHPLRFNGVTDFKTSDERTNVASWQVDMESHNPAQGLKVALRPFEGCVPGQETRGVVLKAVHRDYAI